MASPTAVATATQGRSSSFSASFPRHPSRRPPFQARPQILPSVLHFPCRSRRWSDLSLWVTARVPCCRSVASCLKNSLSLGLPEEDDDSSMENYVAGVSPSSTDAIFDMKLPRRSLLVQFTCNSCGERTERIINRVAYERGTVFVQCAGCLVHHKLIDNLNLVVEYDLRNDTDTEVDARTQG